jgi:hypothetical protein
MDTSRLRGLLNELTTVKLSLQLLRLQPDRCHDSGGLIDTALHATDEVIDELRDDAAAEPTS